MYENIFAADGNPVGLSQWSAVLVDKTTAPMVEEESQ